MFLTMSVCGINLSTVLASSSAATAGGSTPNRLGRVRLLPHCPGPPARKAYGRGGARDVFICSQTSPGDLINEREGGRDRDKMTGLLLSH